MLYSFFVNLLNFLELANYGFNVDGHALLFFGVKLLLTFGTHFILTLILDSFHMCTLTPNVNCRLIYAYCGLAAGRLEHALVIEVTNLTSDWHVSYTRDPCRQEVH